MRPAITKEVGRGFAGKEGADCDKPRPRQGGGASWAPPGHNPREHPLEIAGREEWAVEANVGPDQAIAASRGARVLRIVLVWGVHFTGECLAEVLERDPSVSVAGLYYNLSEAAALNAALQADVILLDARMPDGAAEVRRALDAAPGLRIVVSAVRETEDDIVTWAEAGALGYIPRTTPL